MKQENEKKWKNIHNNKKEKLYRTYKQKKKKSQNVPIDMADTYTNKLLYKWYLHGWYMMRNDSLPIKIVY